MEELKSFSKYILQIGYKYGLHSVFEDFLEVVVCSLSLGTKEDRYHEIVRKYEKPDAYLMAEAFGALVLEMDNEGQGLKDCFGDFYMEYLSHGHNGQFFTPEHICELMARMLNPTGFGERVADCCCGSGRMLLAAAKISRDSLFFGADIERTCAMMCLINLCLNGLLGEVCWMDKLLNRFYAGWRIELHPAHRVPYIREITESESYVVLRLPEKKEEIITKQVPIGGVSQQLLFEF
ncbi:N-6 DNA methylase [Maribellus comscasis]|uniref:site-specific DNA-methyltransferase (adenine-specific) n=1 Tax=Maribellus comscasis TaxID=2681766 RepID=A0A6I6JYB5_9BACT|nr:N-6 DNA methylase [Maribellus comscasis]QGY46148.1 N-6 DNA methylase [Maribellus comscasis]